MEGLEEEGRIRNDLFVKFDGQLPKKLIVSDWVVADESTWRARSKGSPTVGSPAPPSASSVFLHSFSPHRSLLLVNHHPFLHRRLHARIYTPTMPPNKLQSSRLPTFLVSILASQLLLCHDGQAGVLPLHSNCSVANNRLDPRTHAFLQDCDNYGCERSPSSPIPRASPLCSSSS
jgi:hypothetical protein